MLWSRHNRIVPAKTKSNWRKNLRRTIKIATFKSDLKNSYFRLIGNLGLVVKA